MDVREDCERKEACDQEPERKIHGRLDHDTGTSRPEKILPGHSRCFAPPRSRTNRPREGHGGVGNETEGTSVPSQSRWSRVHCWVVGLVLTMYGCNMGAKG